MHLRSTDTEENCDGPVLSQARFGLHFHDAHVHSPLTSPLMRRVGAVSSAVALLCVCGIVAMPGASRAGQPDSTAPTVDPSTPLQVFRTSCLECHDKDGRGRTAREEFPKIPDFTDPGWQDSQSDAELGRAILEGRGKAMPRMRQKLGSVDVKQMVAFVRAFRGGKQVVAGEVETTPATSRAGQPDLEASASADRSRHKESAPSPARDASVRAGS